jgi:DNA-binding transcriptional LysR family regulator
VLFAQGSHTRAIAEEALQRLGAPTTIVAESNQPEVLRTMVELGVGSTVLPVVQAGSDFGPGRVIAERTLVLARRDGAAVDPAAEMLAVALRN